jgi:leucyl-tRNA synthetase
MSDVKMREEKWQKRWSDAKVFEVHAKPGVPKFFMTNPYPYISGSLHIGHARVVTESDVYARFQRMTGKNTLYPMAFHISGTPVLGISLAIKNGDEKKTELYRSYIKAYVSDAKEVERILKSFEEPQNIVDFFIPKMQEEFKTLGLGVDWRRSFTSGDFDHQALVEWMFHIYKERGYLKQGSYPILYSITLQNAVGEDDIADGDVDPVETQEFTLIKFKFESGYLVAATLRPETMYGQTNLWVNPTLQYVRAMVDGEEWVISRECAEKLSYQEKSVEIISEIAGKDLIGKSCMAPFIEKSIMILPSKHCDSDIGTGIVTSVPSDAPFDYVALKEVLADKELLARIHLDPTSVAPIAIITSKGYGDFPAEEICTKLNIRSLQDPKLAEATQEIYKVGFHTGIMSDSCGEYAGLTVQVAKEKMKQKLIEEKRGHIFYETSRKAKSRDGGKVIVAVLQGQWFLDFNAPGWKEVAGSLLQHMELIPDKYRSQFEDVFAWLDKRPCARRRGLGTKLPFDKEWVIESLSDSTIYMTLYPIAHTLRREGITKEQLITEFFDCIMLDKKTTKDAAAATGIAQSVLEELKQEWEYWYPFDQRHTFTAHLSNHLSFMIFAHAAIFEPKRWPKRISFHGVVVSEGEKMSKSKGNVVSLIELKERFGADAFRAFMCNSTSVESTFNWQTDAVDQMRRHLATLSDVLLAIQSDKSDASVEDAALLSRIERAIQQATAALERMDLRGYSMVVLYEMLTSYKRAIKGKTDEQRRAMHGYLGNRWIAMLTPLVPHLAEEMWEKDQRNVGFVSDAVLPVADTSLINERAEADQEFAEDILSNVRKNLQLKNMEKPKSIVIYQAQEWKYAFVSHFRRRFQEFKDPMRIANAIMEDPLMQDFKDEVFKLTGAVVKNMKLLPIVDRSMIEERELLELIAQSMSDELGCPVALGGADAEDPKAKNGLPGKPAIVIL